MHAREFVSVSRKLRASHALNLSVPPPSRIYEISHAPTEYSSVVYLCKRSCLRHYKPLFEQPSANLTKPSLIIRMCHASHRGGFCRIWSLVIHPNHHCISAPNLSANTLFKFSSLEKSFQPTVKST